MRICLTTSQESAILCVHEREIGWEGTPTGTAPTGEVEGILAVKANQQALQRAAQTCKVALSTAATHPINVTLHLGEAEGCAQQHHHLQDTVTHADLNSVLLPIVERLSAPLDRLAIEYKLAYARPLEAVACSSTVGEGTSRVDRFAPPPRRVTQLILVGGGTKTPAIRQFAESLAGMGGCGGVDPEHCVALGAAVHAGLMEGSVAGGLELTDSVFVQEMHGRISGFQM
jgi:molecular chaperone DnaK